MNGLYEIAYKFSLDMFPLKNIESMIVSCDYRNTWIWKSKWNKNRKYNAVVQVDHDVMKAAITLKIKDKNETIIYNNELAITKPDEWQYAPILGKLSWQSDNEVVLQDNNNKIIGKWRAE